MDSSGRYEHDDLHRIFPGDSEMARRMRAFDWSRTDLGPPEFWPQNLRIAVSLCLTSRFPILLWWGPNYVVLYNDAYIPFLGEAKHPRSLGRPGREVWGEIWDPIGPMLEGVRATATATWSDDFLFFFARRLPREEVYVRFTFGPILSEDGRTVEGIFCPCTEITQEVVGARRLETLRALGARAPAARSVDAACRGAASVLAQNPRDVPFAGVYLVNDQEREATLTVTTGLADGHPLPLSVSTDVSAGAFESLNSALRHRRVEEFDAGTLELRLTGSPWPEPPRRGLILPVFAAGKAKLAAMVAFGVSPRQVLDGEYRTFFDLIARHFGAALAHANAYEAERRRAEALAEIDRAKTTFFSNVSHEFRTPLTLMVGPIEDALADTIEPLPDRQRERLEVAHRSSLRLMKLVNTLLDFSRIEAGRVQAVYEPTDLAKLTAELASNFQSTCERAGLRLVVDCPPLPEPVHVDRDMWEKVVLNLVSNAFKFTLEGEIVVHLRAVEKAAELTVSDTGLGIPAEELPRIFERFHRVEAARGRTHEGTGIGLALVQELVKLHAGSIRAQSTYGQGSTFIVSVPLGKDHLPPDRIGSARTRASTAVGATAYAQEALHWLETERVAPTVQVEPARDPSSVCEPTSTRPRIVWADDNADMREYVRRLLSERYDVEPVADGEAALAAARARPPDLVLADVMMPRMDGFALLRALRSDPATATIPVILLSARAGEESRVEGLEAGADDYLVKPFSAQELLARVRAHVEMNRLRREAFRREEALLAESRVAKQQLETVLQGISDGFVALDCDFRYVALNERACASMGVSRDAILGRRIWDLYPDTIGTRFEAELRRAVAEQQTRVFEFFYPPRDRWYENRVYPSPDGVSIFFADVTERRHAEKKLRQSQGLLAEAQALAHIGSWNWDVRTNMIAWSDEHYRIFGLEPDTGPVSAEWAIGFIHPDDREVALEALKRSVNDREPYDRTLRIVRADGVERIVHSRGRAECDDREGGRPLRVFGTLQDVTDRVRAEAATRAATERLELAMRGSSIGIWDLELAPGGEYRQGPVQFINIWEALGYAPREFPRDAVASRALGHPDDLVEVDRAVAACLAGATQEISVENRIRHKDGSYRWFLTLGKAVRDLAGTPARLVGIVLDITERKQTEEALRASEERLAAELAAMSRLGEVSTRLVQESDSHSLLLDIVDAAIAITAADMGNIQLLDRGSGALRIVANRGFAKPFLDFFSAVDDSRKTACGMAMRNGGRVVVEDVTTSPIFANAPPLGVLLEAGVRAVQSTPLIGRFGQLVGMLSTYYRAPRVPGERDLRVLDLLARQAADWIERIEAQAAIEHAKEAAERANLLKDDFLATVSHELRTPLAGMLLWAQILESRTLSSADAAKGLAAIRQSAQVQQQLIEDLLDISRILAGEMRLYRHESDLATIVQDALNIVRPAADAKQILVEESLDPRVPRLSADAARLQQVVLNLLNNAIKFSPEGSRVTVRLERTAGGAQIQVTDAGQGIAPDFLPHIFQRFRQAESSSARRHGGLGLGLAIARELVELHDGSIRAQSLGVGKGATFTVELPASEATFEHPVEGRPAAEPPADAAWRFTPSPVLRGVRALVVEDDATSRDVLQHLLQQCEAQVTAVDNASDALREYESQLRRGRRFDIVLSDIGLPETNGHELARQIRAAEQRADEPPAVAIALTAYAREQDRADALAAGFNAHLSKPVRAATLISTVTRCLQR